ncbi:cation-transporting P-type ATPase [Methylophaga sp. OBS4]|uniref:cation-transporting P-type ATPase n=1 Tax=Methylophaga sp. OBS4 TaxID=2991935 RepID=UPI00224F58AE|nr:cation-transporting P-type ATPase [Methylophaga sp. OBS4]MCX4188220.1 cation-transporting P-type ATPase [Methylophaga sp. OBS4]
MFRTHQSEPQIQQFPLTAWHALSPSEVCDKTASSEAGLDTAEAGRRLAQFGPNRLPESKKRSLFSRFLAQCHNVLIYVLLAAALITALLEHWVDSAVIFAVVLINALIGLIQEGKAEDAILALKTMLSSQASVLRDNSKQNIPAEQLVVGDVVFLQAGDKVPADLRLLQIKNLQLQEAALTGESLPVSKAIDPLPEDTVLADRDCLAFSGTLVTCGQATGMVVATGGDTELGRISAMLSQVTILTTPLLRQMAQFGHQLTLLIIAVAFVTMVLGVWLHDFSWSDMFIAAVSLAVAAIPEGLPAVMTITLAIGVQKMAARRAIIRRLPAVETLGAVTVICSDKTGTLTRNEMTVTEIVSVDDGVFAITGVGYDPHGSFEQQAQIVNTDDFPALITLSRALVLCNDAHLKAEDNGWRLLGDPTEGALLTLAMKAGLDPVFERERWPRVDSIPFESEHQFMASLHHDHEGHFVCYLKGAPERIFNMCDSQGLGEHKKPLDLSCWQQQLETMAGRGQRVLAIACKVMPPEPLSLNFDDVADGLTLIGLVGMIDPPRQEAIDAVRECQSAGIKVKMITGDHVVTAAAIAEKMGLGAGEIALEGQMIESMDDMALASAVSKASVFARATPEHKLRLVTALQANGEVVAMTGDGVNDAPALKRADVGTAMGQNGTEVAKEAAEMVLADDNFASIVNAVEEGRTVYDNLKKAILFILPTNTGEALIVIAAIMLGMTLPITPPQILWVNMITAVTLALALAFEPSEPGLMQRKPRDSKAPILTLSLLWRIAFVGVVLMLGSFGLFLWEMQQGSSIEYARTVAVNTLVMFEIFYLFNSRYIKAPVLNREGLLGNRYALMAIAVLLVFQLAFTYLPPMQLLFGSSGLTVQTWLVITLVASTVLWLVELEKWLIRKRH